MPPADTTPLTALSDAFADVVQRAAPTLVSVHSHRAMSSGFVWKPGLIVTADEALAEEGEIEVILPDGRRAAAKVAGRDPTTDVALLRADTGDAPAVVFGDAPARAGALVVVVGAREGAPVAAVGIVAASGPAWRAMRGGAIDARIELDLSLRAEAEGGLALGADGQALGMAVYGPRRRVLVIPGATILRVAGQLEAKGRIARGYLGLGMQAVKLDTDGGLGAMVMRVDPDGPGARAGIHQGDVVTGWDGQPIASVQALLRSLGSESVGRTVAVSVRRGGETLVVDLVIGERP
jgi:S1-C subfamily serine protease